MLYMLNVLWRYMGIDLLFVVTCRDKARVTVSSATDIVRALNKYSYIYFSAIESSMGCPLAAGPPRPCGMIPYGDLEGRMASGGRMHCNVGSGRA